MEIDPVSGLPVAISDWKDVAKTQQEIIIKADKRRFGKIITIVTGLDGVDIKDVGKKLKAKLACGGTIKDGNIELQGNHKQKTKEALIGIGFQDEQIKW